MELDDSDASSATDRSTSIGIDLRQLASGRLVGGAW